MNDGEGILEFYVIFFIIGLEREEIGREVLDILGIRFYILFWKV